MKLIQLQMNKECNDIFLTTTKVYDDSHSGLHIC